MQLASGLSMYWTALDRAQIGLDPRTGVALDGLTRDELALIDTLALPRTRTEFIASAAERKIQAERATSIIEMLSDANVLRPESSASSDLDAHWRIRHEIPEQRQSTSILLCRADHLGVAIAQLLVQSGIRTITCRDTAPIGAGDHPDMQRLGFGQPRAMILTTVLREIAATTRTVHEGDPHLAVLTGHHAIDPVASNALTSEGLPVFHATVEEYDVVVGPLTIPHSSTCASCVYLHRADATKDWDRLGPQVLAAPAFDSEAVAIAISAALATREILAFIDGHRILLTGNVWRVGPLPELPELSALAPHPLCGCGAHEVATV